MTDSQLANSSSSVVLQTSTLPALANIIPTNKANTSTEVSDTVKLYNAIKALFWDIVPPILLVLGTFGNVMTVIIMRGMRSSKSSACLYFYFTALAISDECILLLSLVFYWVDMEFTWPASFFRFNILCAFPKFVWNASGIISAWVLVAMTFQRVISVMAPHRVGIVCTMKTGKIIVTIIVIFACAFHGQLLFTWVYWPEFRKCQYEKRYTHVAEILEWLDLAFTSLVPFLWLLVGNSVLIWQAIKSAERARTLRATVEQQTAGSEQMYSMTRTLVITSAAFLVLTLPCGIFDICLQATYLNIADAEVNAMIELVDTIVMSLWISTAASNFYLYVLSGRKFREETARYLCCRKRERAR